MKKPNLNNISTLPQAKNLQLQDLLEFSCVEKSAKNMFYKIGNVEDVKKILAHMPC